MKIARWINGLGEESTSPAYSQFIDLVEGHVVRYVVVKNWRNGEFEVRLLSETTVEEA